MNQLLRNSAILDTETTALHRGAGLREASVYDVQSRKAVEYLLDPNRVKVSPHTPQDVAKFVGSSKDVHVRQQVDAWEKVIVHEIFEQSGIKTNELAFMDSIKHHNEFLYKAITSGQFPQVLDIPGSESERIARLASQGINVDQRKTSVQQMLKELPDQLRGKTVWIANAVFESKQIGSQLAADGTGAEFKKALNLETWSPHSPDPFYVTGREVNQARVIAQMTGDWRGVFQAYARNTPKAGQTAVRDIQDVVRATMSYGRESGLFKGGSQYFGTGIDVSHRLMALASGDTKRAAWAEAHRATEDAAVHEAYVLQKSTDYATTLHAVQEGTTSGQELKRLGMLGEGPLAEATKYFSLLEQAAPHLQKQNLLKRLHRADIDLQATGSTFQTTGPSGFYNMSQITAEGYETMIPRVEHGVRKFTQMDDLISHLQTTGEYSDFGINVGAEAKAYRAAATNPEAAAMYVNRMVGESAEALKASSLIPSTMKLRNLQGESKLGSIAMEAAGQLGKNPKILLGAAAAMTAAGAAWGLIQSKPKDQSSLLGYNYYDWLKAQEGMVTQGLASENRPKNTDFGSPYRGPVVSQQVFEDQKMMNERERWLRGQYHAGHYDPLTGLFASLNVFRMKKGYSFIHAGQKVESGYQGLSGNNLVSLNLNEGWKISVEDADTITVRKGGVRGGIASFFGLNQGYSFRLGGIDSPETAHQGRQAQPYAEEAKAALQSMMDGAVNSEIVFDPNNVTYGRAVGAIVADGRNLNYEMVKRGVVGHLPYGKQQNSIVNYAAMRKAEAQAHGVQRGLWGTPWGQAVYDITEGGQRPTFNTLADMGKVVQNSGYMSLVATANAAEAQGYYNPAEAQGIGKIMGGKDPVGPTIYEQSNPGSGSYMAELMAENSRMIKTHGGGTQNKFSRRGGYGKLEGYMALDSMGSTNSVWSRRRYGVFDTYRASEAIRAEREGRMAMQQRATNQQMFQSPIGHYRM